MSHPFRHELSAAHARIEQLENQLADARRRGNVTLRPPPHRARNAAPIVLMLGCVFVGVGFSLSAVSRIGDTGAVHRQMPSINASLIRSPIVTVAPQGLSAWQVGNVASHHAAELNVACGGAVEPTSVSLELDVDVTGHVERAQSQGPDTLARCTENQARFWQFPSSDGVTHTTVPLYFRPSLAAGAPLISVPPSPGFYAGSGALAVTCEPQCDAVLEDGEPIGRAPILSYPTSPGRHTLELIAGTHKRTVITTVYTGRTTDVHEDVGASDADLAPF